MSPFLAGFYSLLSPCKTLPQSHPSKTPPPPPPSTLIPLPIPSVSYDGAIWKKFASLLVDIVLKISSGRESRESIFASETHVPLSQRDWTAIRRRSRFWLWTHGLIWTLDLTKYDKNKSVLTRMRDTGPAVSQPSSDFLFSFSQWPILNETFYVLQLAAGSVDIITNTHYHVSFPFEKAKMPRPFSLYGALELYGKYISHVLV